MKHFQEETFRDSYRSWEERNKQFTLYRYFIQISFSLFRTPENKIGQGE